MYMRCAKLFKHTCKLSHTHTHTHTQTKFKTLFTAITECAWTCIYIYFISAYKLQHAAIKEFGFGFPDFDLAPAGFYTESVADSRGRVVGAAVPYWL